jgi:histone H3/H4
VSKLKNYVKAKSGMNTSGDVPDELSNFVRAIVNRAVDEAHKEGRKTLMARDFKNIEIN